MIFIVCNSGHIEFLKIRNLCYSESIEIKREKKKKEKRKYIQSKLRIIQTHTPREARTGEWHSPPPPHYTKKISKKCWGAILYYNRTLFIIPEVTYPSSATEQICIPSWEKDTDLTYEPLAPPANIGDGTGNMCL